MGSAMSSAVTGLQAHQTMLDVAGNNLANVSTTGYKSSGVTFSSTLSQTLKSGTAPNGSIGGINPQQIGSGTQISNIYRNMTQGGFDDTGNDLDMAIDGNGFFVFSDGKKSYYTRIGKVGVDEENNLIDPSTGYKVQRIGNVGEADGFQSPTSSSITVPYGRVIPPKATSEISVGGSLRTESSGGDSTATTQVMRLGTKFLDLQGDSANETTKFSEIEQMDGLVWTVGDKIVLNGTAKDGSSLGPVDILVDADTTLGDVVAAINASAFGADMTASLKSGEIYLTSNDSGYTRSDMTMDFDLATGQTIDLPKFFTIEQPGGNDVAKTNITIFDSQGAEHVLSGAFVRTDEAAKWDFVITSVTGDVYAMDDRRVEGIQFKTTGQYDGLDGLDPNGTSLKISFGFDPSNSQTISLDLGVKGTYDGLNQVPTQGNQSTEALQDQDGYTVGELDAVTVDETGNIIGQFTNKQTMQIATIRLATFQNPEGLEAVGNGYYKASGNSGEAMESAANSGGTGSIRTKSLEKSNVNTAVEFVRLMEAQNGYQANARTIKVANDILKELTNLIR